MNYTAEELKSNYEALMAIIEDHITGDRKDQLLKLYRDHEERIMMMPASGTAHYHNCFIGGYVDHVLRVVKCAQLQKGIWQDMKATINYTDEELIFAAINHDLGKIGSEEAEQYIHNPSDWHRKNQGKLYTNNPVNAFMTVPDRSLKLLTDRGISISENEWFGIKLHDGMYEEANKAYYIGWNPDSSLRTNLPYVLHQADMMASRIEKELVDAQGGTVVTPSKKSNAKSKAFNETDKAALQNTFDKLFSS
tara:strand:- start:668 stop:1417 length:750 start_codon:yes stop_codon:yes gene_type:complete